MRVLLHADPRRGVNGAERYTEVLERFLRASDRVEEVRTVRSDELDPPPGEWDIVHGVDLTPHRAAFASRAGLPIVMTSHVAGWQNVRQGWRTGRRNPLLRAGQIGMHGRMLLKQALAIRDSAAIIPVSRTTRDELLVQAPWAKDKMRVVENGVDPDAFPPGLKDEGYALYVGRMEPQKQPHLVVEAFARMGLPLRMVGRGVMRARLEATAPPNVRFERPADDAELARLYQGASVCVFPSQSEGYPLVVLEALSSGAPVISHRSFDAESPARDLVHWLDHGVFAKRPPREQTAEAQVRDIVHAVNELWGTKTPEEAVRRHQTVRAHNSWAHTAERTIDVYEQVLRRASG